MEQICPQVDVEALIARAMKSRSPEIRDELIDLEVDYLGQWVGFSQAEKVWHRILPDNRDS